MEDCIVTYGIGEKVWVKPQENLDAREGIVIATNEAGDYFVSTFIKGKLENVKVGSEALAKKEPPAKPAGDSPEPSQATPITMGKQRVDMHSPAVKDRLAAIIEKSKNRGFGR